MDETHFAVASLNNHTYVTYTASGTTSGEKNQIARLSFIEFYLLTLRALQMRGRTK